VVNCRSRFAVTKNIELFTNIQNALNARYATFAALGNPTGLGAPGIPAGAVANGRGVDNRFLGPAPPIAIFGGVRVTF
jgi:outer membrane receptor protein involved in Fe transport